MFYNLNRDRFKPPDDVLAKCARVTADGDLHKPKTMRDWARAHCESFIWWESTDMSDSSSWPGPDFCVYFYFYRQEDATAFRLRWS